MRKLLSLCRAWPIAVVGALLGANACRADNSNGAVAAVVGTTGGLGGAGAIASGMAGMGGMAGIGGMAGMDGVAGMGGMAGMAGTGGMGGTGGMTGMSGAPTGTGGQPAGGTAGAGAGGAGAASGSGTGGQVATGAGGEGGSSEPEGINVYFSEYIEGVAVATNAVEIFNAGSGPVDLASCSVSQHDNGASAPSSTFNLTGSLASGNVFVLCSQNASTAGWACDMTTAAVYNFVITGNDAVSLRCGGVLLDVVGVIGDDPAGGAWTDGALSTQDQALRRLCTVTRGSPSGNAALQAEWDGPGDDDATDLGQYDCP